MKVVTSISGEPEAGVANWVVTVVYYIFVFGMPTRAAGMRQGTAAAAGAGRRPHAAALPVTRP